MNEKGRKELGRRIRAKRIKVFGTSTAAEREAKVNNATLKRAEQGLPVRDDRLAAIIKALWPASDGDWERLDQEVDNGGPESGPTVARNLEGVSNDELLKALGKRLGLEVTTLAAALSDTGYGNTRSRPKLSDSDVSGDYASATTPSSPYGDLAEALIDDEDSRTKSERDTQRRAKEDLG